MSKLFEILSWLFFAIGLLVPDSLVQKGIQPILAHVSCFVIATFWMTCSIKYAAPKDNDGKPRS